MTTSTTHLASQAETHGTPHRACVIGAGIAGLTAAHGLVAAGVHVDVLEREAVVGGRADVRDGAEHCPRVVLPDYHVFLALLDTVPNGRGGTIRSDLVVMRRMQRSRGGWRQIDHLYGQLARSIPWRERAAAFRERRSSLLLADTMELSNDNVIGSRKQMSRRSFCRVLRNLATSRYGMVFPGATDTFLFEPWTADLVRRGVRLSTGVEVTGIRPTSAGWAVSTSAGDARYDAVVLAAFEPDAIAMLDSSGLGCGARPSQAGHAKVLTVELDPREPVLADDQPAFYSYRGLHMLVQPAVRRCVVACTRSRSTRTELVVPAVTELLDLRYEVGAVRERPNSLPAEGIFMAEYRRPGDLLGRPVPGLHLAGSYLRNAYPVDSAEGAALTGRAAARAVVAQLGSPVARG